MFTNILVGYDGSEPARLALEFASDLAALTSARVTALAVQGPLPRYAATIGEVDEMLTERERFFSTVLEEAVGLASERGTAITTALASGHPAQALVKHARDIGADLLVVGHRAHFPHDFALGSTASRVVRHAHCAVLVVR